MFKLFYSYLTDPAILCRISAQRAEVSSQGGRLGTQLSMKTTQLLPSWPPQCALHSPMSISLLPEFTGSSLTAPKLLPKALPDPHSRGTLCAASHCSRGFGASQNHPQARLTLGPRTPCHSSLYIQQHIIGAQCSVHAD